MFVLKKSTPPSFFFFCKTEVPGNYACMSCGFKHCRAHCQTSLKDDASLRKNVPKGFHTYIVSKKIGGFFFGKISPELTSATNPPLFAEEDWR